MHAEISWLPARKQFNWRLMLIFAIAVGIMAFVLFPLVRYQFDHGMPSVNGVIQVDLESLGDFVFDRDHGTIEDVPRRFCDLDGKKIALEGFMWTSSSSARIPNFQFVATLRQNTNQPPLVQSRVFVYVPGGHVVDYLADKCRIVGTLHVKVDHNLDDGRVDSIYTMDLDHVEK